MKNTLMLYIRMLFIMFVSLYSSRILLRILGVEDFGIYNVVGGIVALMAVLNGAMSSSIQRYFSFELGKGDLVQLKKTFCISLNIYFLFCLVFILLAETLGLWFLNNQMIISPNRIRAANLVYQCSIFAMINSLLVNPYNAIIIAHEKMDVFATVSILDGGLRLAAVFLITSVPCDNLVSYAILYLLSQVIVSIIYCIYCTRHYQECHYKFYRDSKLHKELLTYSGWNLFGAASSLAKTQGLNILLNMFFNPAVNASRAIAYQINTAIVQFSNGFFSAVRPQITKYYAQNEKQEMFSLMIRSSKLTYFLVLVLSLPIIVEAPFVIKTWLGQIPEHSIIFVRLIICISAIDAIALPLMTATHATGKIALYQSLIGSITLLNIPISYLFLKLNHGPNVVFIISLVISSICLFLRLFVLKNVINEFEPSYFIKKVFVPLTFVTLGAVGFVITINKLSISNDWIRFAVACTSSVTSCLLFSFLFGFSPTERSQIIKVVRKKFLEALCKKSK